MVHDNVVTFLRDEYRHGFLLADPDKICTVAFLEHLAGFIEAQGRERCRHCDAIAAELTCQVQNASAGCGGCYRGDGGTPMTTSEYDGVGP
jgi:hypothetical protein